MEERRDVDRGGHAQRSGGGRQPGGAGAGSEVTARAWRGRRDPAGCLAVSLSSVSSGEMQISLQISKVRDYIPNPLVPVGGSNRD